MDYLSAREVPVEAMVDEDANRAESRGLREIRHGR